MLSFVTSTEAIASEVVVVIHAATSDEAQIGLCPAPEMWFVNIVVLTEKLKRPLICLLINATLSDVLVLGCDERLDRQEL